jgi:hypothetical protein
MFLDRNNLDRTLGLDNLSTRRRVSGYFLWTLVAVFMALLVPLSIIIFGVGLSQLLYRHPEFFTVVGLVLAGVLFYLRQTKPMIYGGIEVSIGGITCYYAAAQMQPTVQHVLPFMAAVYIVVRGLDNLSKGLPKSS